MVKKLSELIIQDTDLLAIDLKVLSAAAVAFLRGTVKITPMWNGELRVISGGLTFADIEETILRL